MLPARYIFLHGKARRLLTAGMPVTNGSPGFSKHMLAVFFVVSHQATCRFAPCGTPAVAGFRAVALTLTFSAPDYRRRRFGDVSPLFVS